MEETKNETKEQQNNAIAVLDDIEKNNNNDTENNVIEEKEESEKKEEKQDIEKETLEKKEQEKIIIKDDEKKKFKINPIIIILLILVLLLSIFSTIFAILNINNNKIISGISIGTIDVSDMTEEEAKKTLEEIYNAKMLNEIYFTYGEFDGVITYEALEVKYQIENAVKQAYSIGREGNVFKDNIEILDVWINGRKVKLESVLDIDVVTQISQTINNNIEGAVVQSSYYIDNDKLIITSGKAGVKVDEQELLENIYNSINVETQDEHNITIPVVEATPDEVDLEKIHEEVYKEVKNAYYTKEPFAIYPESDGIDFDIQKAQLLLAEQKTEYEIPLIITKPTKTVKDIGTEAFPDLISTFSTNYVASNVNRTTNLKLAAGKINGTVLLPGEEFSYNKVVGERTIQAGYKEAAVYSNGEVVNGLGGGICQISSTLYDAVVMANLNVTDRRNHQFVTSYLPAGKDATVVYGSQDFKFVNTRNYPVRIEAKVQGGVATINIWGIKEDIEYEISIQTKKTATIAYTTQFIQDPSLPAGTEVVKQEGNNGRKVEAYKVVKLNGQVVSTTLLSKDTYNAMKRIVRVGTGPQQ